MFLTHEQMNTSLSALAEIPSFFGLSFLACKQAGLVDGITLRQSFARIIDPVYTTHVSAFKAD